MPKQYSVIVEPVSSRPYTEYITDNATEAQERKQWIEENIRGLKVTIEKTGWGEEEGNAS